MALERATVRKPAQERAAVHVPAPRVPAAPSPAQRLQRQLGNAGAQRWVALVQRSAALSTPHEPAELEAAATARQVMRLSDPAANAPAVAAGGPPRIHRAAQAAPPAPSVDLRGQVAGGAPLPASVRGFMEPRFNARFDQVRVHADASSAQLARQLDAHAFTVGQHLFFGAGRFQPDTREGKELIAHELTHTIQQGAVVQRSAEAAVAQRSPPRIQRLGIGDALNWIADKANYLPGFRLLTIVLGMNPINFAPVERSAANLLRALLELIPVTGALLAQALDNHGIFARAGAWVQTQVRALGLAGGALKAALDAFLGSLKWSDILDLGGVWERGKRIFTEPIERLIALGRSMVAQLLRLIREAILLPLARLAAGTRGYDLLRAVLGQDPISGEPVARTPAALIGGFMKLIGQEEVWQNLQKANAVARAWAWFQGALAGVMGFVRQIPAQFVNALRALELADLLLLPKAFAKLAGVFGGFVLEFLRWAGNAVWTLLQIIFEVVSPGALAYIKRTGAALWGIVKNPLPFVRNLVRAAKLGFQNFADNFGAHLKAGLIDWLTGSLPGVYMPQAFSLGEIVKFVFSVLGLTWQNIRPKLVKVVGETAVKAMETGFDIVVTLVTEGPAAAWDKVKEHLTNLKDMVIGGISDFVVETVIKKAVPKLVAMFVPGAGFISAIISIYDTIMVFVEKLAQIAQVVTGFIDSIVAIAGGAIDAAAKRVETALAGVLSLAISFLAGFLGLGNIADKLMGLVRKLRATVDKAIDALIAWIVKTAKALFAKVFGKDKGDADVEDDDVRTIAVNRFVELVGPETTADAASKSALSVQNEIGPRGLKSFLVRPAKAEAGYEVAAAASPEELVAALVPAGKDVQVSMHAEIRLRGERQTSEGAAGVLEVKQPGSAQSPALKDKEYGYLSPPDPVKGLGRSLRQFREPSAAIVAPKSGSGPIEVVAWNAGNRVSQSNVSHAEHVFVAWISQRHNAAWRRRIESIDITITRSSCGDCVHDLFELAKIDLAHVPRQGKRLAWLELHCGKLPTTVADVVKLSQVWTVAGSSPKPPANEAEHKKVCKEVLKAQKKKRAEAKKQRK
jgi:uncharacterized membrane protein